MKIGCVHTSYLVVAGVLKIGCRVEDASDLKSKDLMNLLNIQTSKTGDKIVSMFSDITNTNNEFIVELTSFSMGKV